MLDTEGLRQAVIRGDRERVDALVEAALAAGTPARAVLNDGLLPGMDVVGKRFGAKEIFISDVLLSARALHKGLARLKPVLGVEATRGGAGAAVVLGTVRGDLHDIGKNLVGMMLEAGGFRVIDLGSNAGPDKFLQAVTQHRPAVVGLSALLTTTMREMKTTIDHLHRAGVMDGVKCIVGGAPVTADFARTIGADGWAPDAPAAVVAVRSLLAS